MASSRHQKNIRGIIFIDKDKQELFKKVSSRFAIYQTLTFPADEALLNQDTA